MKALQRAARRALWVCAGIVLVACATTYQLTLMPRSSGKLYAGEAIERSPGGEATLTITIEDKIYAGTWVPTAADRGTAFVSGGFGWWGRRSGLGTSVSVENPQGGQAKALLQAADGSGLRCDITGLAGHTGGGICRDDQDQFYDVQIRAK
jgi:hypothetical protein